MTDFSFDETAMLNLENDLEGPVGRELERRAVRGEAAAKRLLSQHGSGRIYRKSNPTRIHQASAPGEAPAVDTGLLRASVGHTVGHDHDGVYAEWGAGLGDVPASTREGDATINEIAVWLELGTRHMAPRPWLRPSVPAAAGDSEL